MDDRLAGALGLLPGYAAQHVVLSMTALALGVAISLPLAVLASQRPRLRFAALAVASLVQTIPGLALLALFYPLLLALSALTTRLFGFGVPALGFLPSLLALTIYSMLPILRNGVTALIGETHQDETLGADSAVGISRRRPCVRHDTGARIRYAHASLRLS
jgi:osmoprotectant transport system substrate-binding protein/osmoprotectant transport system permease protein